MAVRTPPQPSPSDAPDRVEIADELRRATLFLRELASSFERLADALASRPDVASPEQAPEAAMADADSSMPPASADDDDGRDWEAITDEAVGLLRELSHVEWNAGKLAAELHVRGVLTGSRQGVHWKLLRKLGDRVTYEGRGERIRLKPAPVSTASPAIVPAGTFSAELSALEREVQEGLPALRNAQLHREQRTAQLAVWAGQARALRARATDDRALDRIADLLYTIADARRGLGCGFIDALTREWEPPSWSAYCRYFDGVVRDIDPHLETEEEQALWSALAQALLHRPPPAGRNDWEVFKQAKEILGDDHPSIAAARARLFPPTRSAPPPGPPSRPASAPSRPAPAPIAPPAPAAPPAPRDALAMTRGRRALVISTLHEAPEARSAYQTAFKFSDFRWLTANETTAHHVDELVRTLTPGKYHLALFVGPMNHVAERALDACFDAGAQVVTVSDVGIDRMRQAIAES